jgi:hypothetical protein
MTRIFLAIPLLILTLACDDSKNLDKLKEHWITGTLMTEQGDVDSIFFHDCYCNLVDSQIQIHYVYFGGIEGGHLTATVNGSNTEFDLSYMVIDFRAISYELKQVNINETSPTLGETITGSIAVKGQSQTSDMGVYKFDLKGNFKCILRDHTYDYDSFRQDFREYHDSLHYVSLKKVAYTNPDSVTELDLDYKYFAVLKDELYRFGKLRRLTLSKFPTLDGLKLSTFNALEEVRIDSDNLTQLPGDIANIPKLEVLEVQAPIRTVPHLYQMNELKELDLAVTNVFQVSDSIVLLSKLVRLNLSYTEISRVPEEIFHLRHLVELNLPETLKLKKIKTWRLHSLEHLDIPYDYLMYNEQIIENLCDLDWLYIYDNCAEEQDCSQIKMEREEYFKGRLPNVSIQVRQY